MIALAGRSNPIEAPRITGPQTTICTQIGGANHSSVSSAKGTTNAPTMKMMKTAGPSALSAAERSSRHCGQAGTTLRNPWNSLPRPQRGQRQASPVDRTLNSMACVGAGPCAEEIDASEQEQPDYVDEMPVPGRGLEPEMMLGLEMAGPCPEEADDQEGGADDDMEAVEARRHEEGGGIDAILEMEGGVAVFEGLHASEAEAQQDGDGEALQHALAVALAQRVMGPGYR